MSLTDKRRIHYQKQSQGNLDFNTNDIEPKLDQVIANTAHSVFCQNLSNQVVNGSSTFDMPILDIGDKDGPFKVQVAGSETHSMNYTLRVSHDNVTYYPYPLVITNLNGFISSTFDLTFRYSFLQIENPTGTDHTVNLILCARH
tara:strand:- start:1366 stop:1797 length:432 start_codon:yes stop_codon:yes gene_type:complete